MPSSVGIGPESRCVYPPATALRSITMGDAATFYPIGRLGLQCMSGGYPQARASRADSLVILAQNLLVASAAHGKKCSFPTPACGSNAIGLMRDLRFLRDLFFLYFFRVVAAEGVTVYSSQVPFKPLNAHALGGKHAASTGRISSTSQQLPAKWNRTRSARPWIRPRRVHPTGTRVGCPRRSKSASALFAAW